MSVSIVQEPSFSTTYTTISLRTVLDTHTSGQAGLFVKWFPLKLIQPSQMKIVGISWGHGLLVDACWVQSLVVEINTHK